MEKRKIICRDCGAEVDEDGIVFIEEDWGLCQSCAKEVTESIEEDQDGRQPSQESNSEFA